MIWLIKVFKRDRRWNVVPQELLDLASGRVLRLVVPDYVEVDEVEARLMLAIELFREGVYLLSRLLA